MKADLASGYARLNDFAVGYQVWKKHFLFGVGYGNYDEIKKMMPLWRSSNTGFSNSDYAGSRHMIIFGVGLFVFHNQGHDWRCKYKKYNSLSFLLILSVFLL